MISYFFSSVTFKCVVVFAQGGWLKLWYPLIAYWKVEELWYLFIVQVKTLIRGLPNSKFEPQTFGLPAPAQNFNHNVTNTSVTVTDTSPGIEIKNTNGAF